MQFGRIDKNAYTLDFEYPFSAVQALSVALANVTQRFKWSNQPTTTPYFTMALHNFITSSWQWLLLVSNEISKSQVSHTSHNYY